MEGEKAGFRGGDLKVPKPFVSCGVGSLAFGNKNGSGEAVDVKVSLRLSVGVHGNEGVGGIQGIDIKRVVHGIKLRIV